jgi:hypothetical protein
MAREVVSLRIGAQVILVKVPCTVWCSSCIEPTWQNISQAEGLVNGARGVVVRFSTSANFPVVRVRAQRCMAQPRTA